MRFLSHGVAVMVIAAFVLVGCVSQPGAPQIYGTPGSPSATMTISGEQLPPPPKFGGEIARNAAQSKP